MSPIKTRLAEGIGKLSAERIYLRSVALTRETIERCQTLFGNHGASVRPADSAASVTPYWAVAESLGVTHRLWAGWRTIAQGSGDLGERLAHVYTELKREHDIVCLYGADSPHIPASRLADGIQMIADKKADVVVGPAEDGGFYFFASSLSLPPEVWLGVPYSSSDTLTRLRAAIEPGVRVGWSELPREFDIDTDVDYRRASEIEPRLVL